MISMTMKTDCLVSTLMITIQFFSNWSKVVYRRSLPLFHLPYDSSIWILLLVLQITFLSWLARTLALALIFSFVFWSHINCFYANQLILLKYLLLLLSWHISNYLKILHCTKIFLWSFRIKLFEHPRSTTLKSIFSIKCCMDGLRHLILIIIWKISFQTNVMTIIQHERYWLLCGLTRKNSRWVHE